MRARWRKKKARWAALWWGSLWLVPQAPEKLSVSVRLRVAPLLTTLLFDEARIQMVNRYQHKDPLAAACDSPNREASTYPKTIKPPACAGGIQSHHIQFGEICKHFGVFTL
jgi:hypothetical protein